MRKIWEFISSASQSRTTAVLVILVIAAAVPLTVLVAQRQQSYQQKADQGYCAAQTNPAFCTAANGCAWDSSATYTGTGIPPSTPGACVSTGSTSGTGTSTGTGSTTTGGTTTTTTNQPIYSCQGNQICISTNGGTPSCTACTNGLNCVMTAGTPTCTGTNQAPTQQSPTTSGTSNCQILTDKTTVAPWTSANLTLNYTNVSSCKGSTGVEVGGSFTPNSSNALSVSFPSGGIDPAKSPWTYSVTCNTSSGSSISCGSVTISTTTGGGTNTGTTTPGTGTNTGSGTNTGTTTTSSGCNPACTSGQVCGADNQCHTSTDPKQCSIANLGCDFTTNTSCVSNLKSDSNCFTKYTAFAVCTGNTSAAAAQQAQSACGNTGTNTTTSSTTYLRADINHDGFVTAALDYNILIGCMVGFKSYNSSTCGNFTGNADLDKNGTVDQLDYNIWLRLFKGVDPN